MGPGARLGRPAVREVVRRRPHQRGVQLRRPARRGRQGRQGRAALGRRAGGRHPRHHLRRAEGPGLPGRQRPDRARRRDRRPGRDLPADDPRGRRGDAGLRAHRRTAHRGLRRLLLRGARLPRRRLRGEGDHHLRRWLPPRRAVGAQAGGRRGRRQGRRAGPAGRQGARRTPHRSGRRLGRQPRRLVARHRREGVDRARVRVLRLRAPAVRHVHLGHDRQAQGHPAHDGRLPRRHVVHALGRLRPQGRHRRLLVHRRRRLGDRPQLHGLRAALQQRHAGDVRRHAGQPAQGPLVGDHREVRRHDLLHRAHGDPDVHEVGLGHPREVRPVLDPGARVGR